MKIEIEEVGKTEEETLQKIEEKLGVSREKIKWRIVDEQGGLLKNLFGKASVRIHAVYEKPESEAEIAKKVFTDMLNFFYITKKVTVRESTESIALIASGRELNRLIGRKGATLEAMRYLINKIVKKRVGDAKVSKPIEIDINSYWSKRQKSLRDLALRTAGKVQRFKKPYTLNPMPAKERRIIHKTLQDHGQVKTYSKGEGYYKKVVVTPKHAGEEQN